MQTWTFWERVKLGARDAGFIAGALLVLLLVGMAVLGPELAPHNPYVRDTIKSVDGEIMVAPFEPSREYPLGSDRFGRDLWSLLLVGARQTLSMALIATSVRVLLGTTLGTLAGWKPGSLLDRVVTATTEFLAAIPGLILAILLIAAIGIDRGQASFIAAIAVVGISEIAQTVRSHVLSIRTQGYIEAARALGMSGPQILSGHVLPNLLPTLLALSALQVGSVLLLLGELGYLGIFIGGGGQFATLDTGVTRFFTVPDWGAMLGTTWGYFRALPRLPLVPAAAFFVSVLAFNLFGHGLQRFIERGRFHPSGWSVVRLLAVIGVVLFGLNGVLRSSGPEAYFVDLARQADVRRMWRDIEFLTSERVGGRVAGTDGGTLAAGYISTQFEAAGLTPQPNGSYFQPYESVAGRVLALPRLEVSGGEAAQAITDDLGFNPLLTFYESGEFSGDLVVAANLVESLPQGGIVFQFDPAESLQRGMWSRSPYRAVIGIVPDDQLLQRDRAPVMSSEGLRQRDVPHLLIHERAARTLFEAAGLDYDALYSAYKAGDQVRVVTELPLRLTVEVRYDDYTAFNVVGYLPAAGSGSSRRILVVAPYTSAEPYGGAFYPGADDNASGVAVMLELARLLRDVEYQPESTIVFAALDQGGGSQYMLRPIVPTDASDTWTVIVLDGVGAGQDRLARIETGGGYAAMFDSSARRFGAGTVGLEDWSGFASSGAGYSAFLSGNEQYAGLAVTRPGPAASGTALDTLAALDPAQLTDVTQIIAHLIMVLSS